MRIDKIKRQAIWSYLCNHGPSIGVPALIKQFPKVARRELNYVKQLFIEKYRKDNTFVVESLRWRQARTVWAMDFSDPEGAAIEGQFKKILFVRDLASGYILASRPVRAESWWITICVLRELFAKHGAPLVLKNDGGSSFVQDNVVEFLHQHRVLQLVSPPYYPKYNGNCEAGIGSLKTRAFYQAVRNDRPEMWSCDDIECARRDANLLGRPRGSNDKTPFFAFRNAKPVNSILRTNLWKTYIEEMENEYKRRDKDVSACLDKVEVKSICRDSLSRSLVACGLLNIRRRVISPAKKVVFGNLIT